MPLFSVVIPSFNRAEMAKEAVESVFAQTFKDVEILVVDDGSQDNTEALMREFGDRIIFHRQPNEGVAAARNKGASLATGRYICYLDSDDLWPENKLAVMAQTIHRFPELAFIFSDFRKHNVSLPSPYELSNTGMFSVIFKHAEQIDEDIFLLQANQKLELLLSGYPLYPSTFVVRRDVHDQFRWDPGIMKSEDFNFVLRLSKNFDFLYVDQDLATVRVHDTNKSVDFLTKNHTNILSMRLYRDLYADSDQKYLCNFYISQRLFLDGKAYVSKGLYRRGAKLILQSLAYPQNWIRLARKLGARIRGK